MEIKVLIADDHQIIHQALALLLEDQPDISIIGNATDGEEAIRLSGELQPDIVLMDVSLGASDGIAVTQEIRRRQPGSRVLMLSMYQDRYFFDRALAAGAKGYVTKIEAFDTLVNAIRLVFGGGMHFPGLQPA